MRWELIRTPVLSEKFIWCKEPSLGRIIAPFGLMFTILHALRMFVAEIFKARQGGHLISRGDELKRQ